MVVDGNKTGYSIGSEGVIYALSNDKSFASVVGFNGDCERVVVAESYEGVPVVEIASKAFFNSNIRAVEIPDSVIKISERAFSHCPMLNEIEINAEIIDRGAILNCLSLKRIFIGKRVKEIRAIPFINCPLIESLAVDDENTEYRSENGSLLTKDGSSFIRYPSTSLSTEYTLPSTVKRICQFAFQQAHALEKITFSDCLETVEEGAFSDCESLKEINFGIQLYELKSFAFSDCKSLKEIVLPDSLTLIGSNCFTGCEGLKRAVIGAGVKKIMLHAFDNCENLEEVYFKVMNLWKVRREVFGEKELSDPRVAAKYLTATYTLAIWQRLGDN